MQVWAQAGSGERRFLTLLKYALCTPIFQLVWIVKNSLCRNTSGLHLWTHSTSFLCVKGVLRSSQYTSRHLRPHNSQGRLVQRALPTISALAPTKVRLCFGPNSRELQRVQFAPRFAHNYLQPDTKGEGEGECYYSHQLMRTIYRWHSMCRKAEKPRLKVTFSASSVLQLRLKNKQTSRRKRKDKRQKTKMTTQINTSIIKSKQFNHLISIKNHNAEQLPPQPPTKLPAT